MNFIDQIKMPILEELQLFAETFSEELNTDNELLLSVNNYLHQKTGKQLRPILTILSAKACGVVNNNTILGAQALELLHTASLVHDDVVDDTLERRGTPSINAQWSNKTAVFVGDYLFSKSLNSAISTGNLDILKSISAIGKQLTDGELLQLVNTEVSKISEAYYYSIVRKKTAQLFASCGEVGALSVHATDKNLAHLRNFGDYLGISFQIKDDIFDYYDDINIGKPTGNDIRDGKVTLPLIYALKNSPESEKEKVTKWLENKEFSQDNIQYITQFAINNGGIVYAIEQMDLFKQKALAELADFDDGEVKQALKLYAEYVGSREL